MNVYEDGGWCFSCGYLDKSIQTLSSKKAKPEELGSTIDYAHKLPIKKIRGLSLPYDNWGYYIIWPDNSFWKKRMWSGTPRYIGPRGHKPSLFLYPSSDQSVLILVEGELNAISLRLALGDTPITIASFGSAGNILSYSENYLLYSKIYSILDKDAAGVAAGMGLKKEMRRWGKTIHLAAVERDYNQVLQEDGPEGVKKQFILDLSL